MGEHSAPHNKGSFCSAVVTGLFCSGKVKAVVCAEPEQTIVVKSVFVYVVNYSADCPVAVANKFGKLGKKSSCFGVVGKVGEIHWKLNACKLFFRDLGIIGRVSFAERSADIELFFFVFG